MYFRDEIRIYSPFYSFPSLEFTMNIFTTKRFGSAMMTVAMLICVILLVFQHAAVAQPMLNFPESVAWDANTRTYLVSSALNGAIVRRSANGTLTPFASAGLSTSKGIVVAKFGAIDALWVADNKTFKAFNLATGAELGAFLVPDSFEINDVAADSTAGIFYISDPAVGIFRASVSVSGGTGQATFTQIVPPDGINSPNGISFDRVRNRLVVVSFAMGTARIHAVNLRTTPPTVETLATTPNGSGSLDGIARDKQGRYYVSSWDANTITRYDSNFTSPTLFASGLETPADIFFNAATDTLVVPNFNRNTLDFIRIPPPQVSSRVQMTDPTLFAFRLAPNPAREQSMVTYRLPKPATVVVSLLNILGQTLTTSVLGNQATGEHQCALSLQGYPQGVYYCRLQANGESSVIQIQVVR